MIKQMQLVKFLKKYPFAASLLPSYLDKSDKQYYVRYNADFTLFEFGYLSDTWLLKMSDV